MPPRPPAPPPEETELFERTLADARPLARGKRRRVPPPQPVANPPAVAAPPPRPAPAPPRRPPPAATKQPPPLEPGVAAGLDRRTAERLKRGLIPPEAVLDLHGHTQEAAFAALGRFVPAQAARGRRCVLVVTGKGGPEGGVLRRGVPQWLNLPELRPLVLALAPAQPRHGGGGAWYLLLRRQRE